MNFFNIAEWGRKGILFTNEWKLDWHCYYICKAKTNKAMPSQMHRKTLKFLKILNLAKPSFKYKGKDIWGCLSAQKSNIYKLVLKKIMHLTKQNK